MKIEKLLTPAFRPKINIPLQFGFSLPLPVGRFKTFWVIQRIPFDKLNKLVCLILPAG
jgi:hypothetical protein